ncbi:MAG TPA: adenylate/guanylate cyclase domain-containing protein [Pyrinomonadaceae bacterium]|nr:adenylate/guanylate cyclase domain-containing protein [Pyrinomonadaceae bacterium]
MALLHITDATGRRWQVPLSPRSLCTIGRAPDNSVVLNDPRASRYHAHVKFADGAYVIIDGRVTDSGVQRSANKVLIDGKAFEERALKDGEKITIGGSTLRFEQPPEAMASSLTYNDQRLGRTQLALPVKELLQTQLKTSARQASTQEEIDALRRKADILALLYEMSQTLGSVFDLDQVFEKATDIIFRVTPADRVVALLRDERLDGDTESGGLRPVAMRLRDEKQAAEAKTLTIGRTITRKVMRERVALLSQDAAADAQFASVNSIIAQGVRSTMCAPLVAESAVHGALYADRLDESASFTRDDLELLSAITAQTAVAVENVRSHERLAREEVARANYSRFMPEYVVRQMLEHPESFKLGGVNQTITVLFADVRGFTRLAEHAPPEQVVQLLNHYFTAMSDIIFAYNGTLDKYIGDGLMALFGAPTATPEDAFNAATVAVAMQRRIQTINAEFRAKGLPEISIGVGLHTGEATVGYIGSERRTEYTAIGDTVNLASRLESNARGGQILLSDATVRAIPEGHFTLRQHEPLTVKNRVQPVPVSELLWQPSREDDSQA